MDWSKVESPLERQKRRGDAFIAKHYSPVRLQETEPPRNHENDIKLYLAGILDAGFMRQLAKGDDILSLKLDRLGVPTSAELLSEMRNEI